MLTVACVWVHANVPYGVEYVERLAAMVSRHLSQPHRFVCLTDRPWMVPNSIQTHPIARLASVAGWWAKLHLFNPANGLSGRVLYLDLDTLIVGSLDPIAEWPAAMGFATIPDTGSTFQPKNGLSVIKRFNSSVMSFEAGVYPDLWHDWELAVADRLWGDQDWLAERHPEAATMPAEWFPRMSAIGRSGQIPREAKVILAKKPKPHACDWPWVQDIWRAA